MDQPEQTKPQRLPINHVARKKFYDEYNFPLSDDRRVIVRATEMGFGFETAYFEGWSDIVDPKSFEREISCVGNRADQGEQDMPQSVSVEKKR